MKKIMNWIAIDGLLHILISIILTTLFYPFIGYWVVILTFCIGLGKEIYDVKKKSNYTCAMVTHDLICDIMGIGLGLIFCLIMF